MGPPRRPEIGLPKFSVFAGDPKTGLLLFRSSPETRYFFAGTMGSQRRPSDLGLGIWDLGGRGRGVGRPGPGSAGWLAGRPAGRPSESASQQTSQPTSPANQPASRPTNQPASQPNSQPSQQPASQPIRQPTNQPTNELGNKPI